MLPPLLYFFAILFLSLSMVLAIVVMADLTQHPQKMRVMNYVWVLTMLYLGPFGFLFYWLYGRNKSSTGRWFRLKRTPFWAQVMKSAMHCGAGCALGDFVGEWLVYGTGFQLWGSLLAGRFLVSFILAYLFGLLFQFFAMPPKRTGDARKLLWRAIKSDTASLAAYEIGMFGWMAFARFLYPDLEVASWDYWFMIQIAMIVGLATTYPVNRWLLTSGVKQAM